MIKRSRGFTLVELLVAMVVLSISLITIFQLLGASSQRSAVSSDLFSAIHLGAKMRAGLGEENRLHPAFIEMVHEFPEMTDREEVVDGKSWYFRWGKDRNAPFGIINEVDGPALIADEAALYSEFKPFRASFVIQRIEPASRNVPESHLCETAVKLEWQDKSGKAHEYRIPGKLFSPGRGIIPDGLLINPNELENLSRLALFPDCAGMSLEEAANLNGCDKELARHAGKITALMLELDKSVSSITADIAGLVKKRLTMLARPDRKLAELQIQIARKTEDGASLLYNVLAECQESWEFLSAETDPARLGSIPAAPYVQGLKLYAALGPQITDWVEDAGAAYEWLLQPGMEAYLTSRERENAVSKRLESFRLLLKLKPTGSVSASFALFIKREADRVAGRNPHLAKFFLREESLRKDTARYSEVFPNLADILRRITKEIWPNGKAVPDLIARHSQGGQL